MQTRCKIRRYTLEERKYIYSRPLEEQFVPVFKCGEAVVFRHLIRSVASEDYVRVLDVARALAVEKQGPVYILPEINAHEKALRASLGLSADNGRTPDIMLLSGVFVDVKSPKVFDKMSKNAGKAFRQSALACISDHRLPLDVNKLDEYAKRVLCNNNYQSDDVYFFIKGQLYKKTRE